MNTLLYMQRGRLTLICSGIVQVEEDGNENVQHVAALQHEEEEFLKHMVSSFNSIFRKFTIITKTFLSVFQNPDAV